jgi:hypothetical protein
VDDAFITFRYVDNGLEDNGLVWNPGERLPVEYAALLLGAAAYLLLLGAVASAERELAGGGPLVPLATGLLAVQYTVTAFASTGLETELAAACVVAGGLLLVREGPWAALGAGAAFVAAGILRMDHLLAYAVGGAWLLLAHRSPRVLLAYAACVPLLLMLAWTGLYYGEVLPNTAHAKVSRGFYADQGLVYLVVYWLGSQLWVALPALLGWPLLARGRSDGSPCGRCRSWPPGTSIS